MCLEEGIHLLDGWLHILVLVVQVDVRCALDPMQLFRVSGGLEGFVTEPELFTARDGDGERALVAE